MFKFNMGEAIICLPQVLLTFQDKYKNLFQTIYRTHNALKIMNESHENFLMYNKFIELIKTHCGNCGGSSTDDKTFYQIQKLISKPELNGKICEKVEILDNGRIKIKLDNLLILSVKPECLLARKIDFRACGKCKIILYCNTICQKKHWKEGGHKEECTDTNNTVLLLKKNQNVSYLKM